MSDATTWARTAPAPAGRTRALLRWQWKYARWAVGVALVLVLVPVWLFPLLPLATFVMVVGSLVAVLAATVIGGEDGLFGMEEFALALPVRRRGRYWLGLGSGAAWAVGLTAFAAASIVWQWPPRVWGLFVETGFCEPFPLIEPGVLFPLAVLVPLSMYVHTYAFAAALPWRSAAGSAWFPATVMTAFYAGLGVAAEWWRWAPVEGWLMLPLLAGGCVPAALWGAWAYERKQVAGDGLASPAGLGVLVAAAALVLGLAGVLVAYTMQHTRVREGIRTELEREAGGGWVAMPATGPAERQGARVAPSPDEAAGDGPAAPANHPAPEHGQEE